MFIVKQNKFDYYSWTFTSTFFWGEVSVVNIPKCNFLIFYCGFMYLFQTFLIFPYIQEYRLHNITIKRVLIKYYVKVNLKEFY